MRSPDSQDSVVPSVADESLDAEPTRVEIRSGLRPFTNPPRGEPTTLASSFEPAKIRGPRQACLVIIYGGELGRREVLESPSLLIGRAPSSDFLIAEASVSRAHARLAAFGGTYTVEDLGSSNGTCVNDLRLTQKCALSHGDQIAVGQTILKFLAGDNVETSYHEEIHRLATIDALTQTYNKRFFDESVDREIDRATRYKRGLALVVLDIDHFKKINDVNGHIGGDAVLRKLGALMKAQLRKGDILARIGGEEFAVLLPEATPLGATVTAERVRDTIQRTPIPHEDAALRCTVSCGVAMLDPGMTATDLFKLADKRLYEAKETGRNRVVDGTSLPDLS